MATNSVETFLHAEDEANRLVDELTRLRQETESYKTSRDALDRAAEGIHGLAVRLGDLAGQLGGVVETLRSIGMPELLRVQEAVTKDVATLREDLANTRRSIIETHQRDMEAAKSALGAQVGGVRTALRPVRNMALGSVALLVMALALLAWVALSLPRG